MDKRNEVQTREVEEEERMRLWEIHETYHELLDYVNKSPQARWEEEAYDSYGQELRDQRYGNLDWSQPMDEEERKECDKRVKRNNLKARKFGLTAPAFPKIPKECCECKRMVLFGHKCRDCPAYPMHIECREEHERKMHNCEESHDARRVRLERQKTRERTSFRRR